MSNNLDKQFRLEIQYLKTEIDVIGLEIGSDKLNVILKHMIDIYSGSRTVVIIDDITRQNNTIVITSSHILAIVVGIITFRCSLNSISTGLRDNATRVICFKTHNKRSLKILREEFFGYVDIDAAERSLLDELNKGRYTDVKLKGEGPLYVIC